MTRLVYFLAVSWLLLGSAASAASDIVVADFEGADYGNWQAVGEAFGASPAQGALPNQLPVSGYEGKGLINSFNKGDDSLGVLTSPAFMIERKYINFLIGGGCWSTTRLDLLIDGKVVRMASGRNDERLDWETWDVIELMGKEARLQIVDNAKAGWGHVNVDQIVMSDTMKVEPFKTERLFDEQFRPQFHFTSKKNWLNDPNGMVFYKGEYHLFFQHNPDGIAWGNMTWGHAVSPDMLHWNQLDHAIYPDELGTIFSGSAVIDWNNTAGFQTGDEKVIVCLYTSAGDSSAESKGKPFTQSIAYSNDCGRTWTKYPRNPVIPQINYGNRDPKVLWHEPSKRWIMALYLDDKKAPNDYGLFGSPNLKDWQPICTLTLPGATECPDFFELPVDGDAKNTKWVFWAANNSYLIGRFDGKSFTRETDSLQSHFGTNRYAAQTFSDIPATDGRRIQIAWMAGGVYPRMPFNQQMSIPVELTLRTFPAGLRVCTQPVKEVASLHGKRHAWSGVLKQGDNPLAGVEGDLFDLCLNIAPGNASEVVLSVRGTPIRYNVAEKQLICLDRSAPVELSDGRLALRVLVDRASIEIFAAEGRVNMADCLLMSPSNKGLELSAHGGETGPMRVDVWELQSTWPTDASP